MRSVAALYVDPRGPYPKIPGVDCWDAARDARKYGGPHPVVAHPPCGSWSRIRHLHQRIDGDCGIRAVEQVRAFGGVLEQPAYSKLFAHCRAPLPGGSDAFGFSIQVEQVSWGHVARKRTWLYFVGVPRAAVAGSIRTGGTITHWASGRRSPSTRNSPRPRRPADAVPAGIKVCSAVQRNRTPPAFAEWLVALARSVP